MIFLVKPDTQYNGYKAPIRQLRCCDYTAWAAEPNLRGSAALDHLTTVAMRHAERDRPADSGHPAACLFRCGASFSFWSPCALYLYQLRLNLDVRVSDHVLRILE